MLEFGIAYIVLGLLTIVGCTLDAPEVRQALRDRANGLIRNAAMRRHPEMCIPLPLKAEPVAFDAERLSAQVEISALQMAELRSISYMDPDILTERAKAKIAWEIYNIIRRDCLIRYEVDTESMSPNVVVRGYIDVVKKRI